MGDDRQRHQDPWPRRTVRSPRSGSLRHEDRPYRGRYAHTFGLDEEEGWSSWSSSVSVWLAETYSGRWSCGGGMVVEAFAPCDAFAENGNPRLVFNVLLVLVT